MELGVQLFSHKVMIAYSQLHDQGGILVEFDDGSKVHTRYLVGADGARSTVGTALLPFLLS
jgi:2-polyprenyl-6-methoxyphenol hydroxylase-like FAD-dependent oxidoreductase